MRLRIWLEDEPLSPDMNSTTYLDIDMRGEWSLPEARALVIRFAMTAHDALVKPRPDPILQLRAEPARQEVT